MAAISWPRPSPPAIRFGSQPLSRAQSSLSSLPLAASGWQRTLATAENFSFQAIDLNSQLNALLDLIDRVQPELVVNFAAQGMVAESWLNPTHWYRTNVVAQVALHDALRQKPFLQKYVHVTTPEVYGSTDGGWIKENHHFAPSTPMP